MDSFGAFLGPLVAPAVLAVAGQAFDAVLVTSFCIAALGVLVLVLFVRDRHDERPPARPASPREALTLLRVAPVRRLLLAACLLGFAVIGDGFVHLLLQRQEEVSLGSFPLLAVGTSLTYLLPAVPVGALADRIGRVPVVLSGYTALLLVYPVVKDGKPYRSADVNYWGVTFTEDDNTFYATMHTKGHRYLVRGDFAARTVRTVRDRVECPSLSPDGTRIAFKAPIDGDSTRGRRLSVLDVATGRVTATAETRSVDDQAAWLDDATLAYAQQHDDGTKDLWSVPADGSGTPRQLLRNAHSPAPLGGPRVAPPVSRAGRGVPSRSGARPGPGRSPRSRRPRCTGTPRRGGPRRRRVR
ncbi:MFS transporter [Streptomyces sp. NPDC048629]|uniref:MFS transporter n=1 Tax=Streptomyces sp. NPDC048629 TaxID=3154824 RepID=UPI00344552B2